MYIPYKCISKYPTKKNGQWMMKGSSGKLSNFKYSKVGRRFKECVWFVRDSPFHFSNTQNPWQFMQPSMANLNSPSSRVVKYSAPFRRRILRCINFGNGESSTNPFLDVVNLYHNKIQRTVNLQRTCVLSFYYFIYF